MAAHWFQPALMHDFQFVLNGTSLGRIRLLQLELTSNPYVWTSKGKFK